METSDAVSDVTEDHFAVCLRLLSRCPAPPLTADRTTAVSSSHEMVTAYKENFQFQVADFAILVYHSQVTALPVTLETRIREVVDLCPDDPSEIYWLVTAWNCEPLQVF